MAHQARNLQELFLSHCSQGNETALLCPADGKFNDVSWQDLLARSNRITEGLRHLGLQPGDRIAIFSSTRFEFLLSLIAILGTGGVVVPVFPDCSRDEVHHILKDSGARAIFVDHDRPESGRQGRASLISDLRLHLPLLQRVISFDRPEETIFGMLNLDELQTLPSETEGPHWRHLIHQSRQARPEDVAAIFYTSGTTGTPKGVEITHANWTYQAWALSETGLMLPKDVVLLFLPMAHVFGMMNIVGWLAHPNALLALAETAEKTAENARIVRPTVISGVPRFFEKVFHRVLTDGRALPGRQGSSFRWASRLFEEYARAKIGRRRHLSVQWLLAKTFVFPGIARQLQQTFGGRVRFFLCGGAPLAEEIELFFQLCDLPILQGYGLTETAATALANLPDARRLGSVGRPLPGIEVKTSIDGEIFLRGPPVMKGYRSLPEETAQAIGPDGWLRTGDVGTIDEDGFLTITDRKKNLIKTSVGKYVAPQQLEGMLRADPLIAQVLIHGDRRKYISALFTLSEEYGLQWAREQGLAATSLSALAKSPEVDAKIHAIVDALSAQVPPHAAIRKFAILDHRWTVEGGELTPSLKLRRKLLEERYAEILDSFYVGDRFL